MHLYFEMSALKTEFKFQKKITDTFFQFLPTAQRLGFY